MNKTYTPHPDIEGKLMLKPDVTEPTPPDKKYYMGNMAVYHNDMYHYECNRQIYLEHLTACKSEQIDYDRSLFPGVVEFVPGKNCEIEYEVYKEIKGQMPGWYRSTPIQYEQYFESKRRKIAIPVAIPIKQESENKVYDFFKDEFIAYADRLLRDKGASSKDVFDCLELAFEDLKPQFTIKRKNDSLK